MAKKKISKEDIAPKDIFANITEGAKATKVQIDLLTKSVKALQSSAKGIKTKVGGAKVGDTKGMKDFDALQKQANQTAKAKINIDKQLLHQKEALRVKQANINKTIKTEIELRKAEKGSLNQVRAESKKLAIEKGKVNRKTVEGAKRIKEINRQLDRNNKILAQNSSKLGKQKMNIGNYGSAVGKLTGMLGKLGLGFGVFTMLKSAFSTVKNFEQSQANLASVLGVNVDAMGALTEQAKELGATTTFTASQVAELQLEFAKLGFTQKQIEGMTESTLLLAEATGSELGETASIVGATMRGFGLDVGETQRVVDVMANSFSKSSLDMSKFATAMSSVAPVANLAGVSLEHTTALLGTLTDRGIDASTAGTGLRNMFLQANKHGLTFNQALNQVENAVDQTGEAMKLFGTRGATLGVVLANNQEGVAELTAKLELSNGAAKAMADTQRDTLGGAIKLLTSAWEGWILKMNESSGAGEGLKDTIKFLADNLETILDMVILATKAFLAYKTVVMITTIQTNIMAMSFVRLGKSQGGIKGALTAMSGGLKNVGKALKANAIGIAIVAIVYAFSKLNSAMKSINKAGIKYKEIQGKIKEIHEGTTEKIGEEVGSLALLVTQIKATNTDSVERGRLLGELNEKYGVNLQNITDETELLGALDTAQQKIIDNMVKQIRLQSKKDEFTLIIQEQQIAEEEYQKIVGKGHKKIMAQSDAEIMAMVKRRRAKMGQANYMKGLKADEIRQNLLDQSGRIQGMKQKSLLNKLIAKREKLEASLLITLKKKNEEEEKDIIPETPEEKKARLAKEKLAGGGTPTVKPFVDLERATQKARLAIIEDARDRENKIRQATFDNLVVDTEAKKTHQKDFDAWKIAQENLLTADLKKINNKFDKQEEDARQKNIIAIKENAILEKEIELDKIADIYENFEETERLRKDIEYSQIRLIEEIAKFDVKNTLLSTGEKEKIMTDAEAKIEKIKKDARLRNTEHDKETLVLLTKSQKEAEEEHYLILLKSSDSQEEIAKKMKAFKIQQLKDLIEFYKKNYPLLEDEVRKMEINLQELIRQGNDDEVTETEDATKEMQELRQTAIQATTDFFIAQADKRIAKLDEEIEAHRKQADMFAQMAVEGNITAKESLAEENRLLAEAEREKEATEKRKQQMLMVSAVIKAYFAELDVPGTTSGEALTKAITSKAVLDAFIGGIGSFYEGTEDTGIASNPLDGNGGRIAVLHNNERVLTARQNKKIGGYSNDEVANIVEQNRLGKLAGNNQIGDSWESQLVVDQLMKVEGKLDLVNKTIENKEVSHVELGAITQSTMKIVESRKKGANRTISTFKVKV